MFALILPIFFIFHPIHVSVTEIEHNPKERSLQVTIRLFLDDFEEALTENYSLSTFDIVEPRDPEQKKKVIREYIMENFKVRVNKKTLNAEYLGSEIEDEVIYCYVELKPCKSISIIEIENTLLFDLYEDQSNLVHITYEDEIKSQKFDFRKPNGKLEF